MVENFLYHESNLTGKISHNYKELGEEFQEFKSTKYDGYKRDQLAITGIDSGSIQSKTRLLDNYLRSVDSFMQQIEEQRRVKITPQSKFRPTVLEEFCGFLFKEIQEITSMGLGFFNKRVFVGITLDKTGNAVVKTKDIDFCIGKQFDVEIGERHHNIIIPLVAIECKTYIDKTMFSESQFTAQKMKQGSPNVRVYVVAEQNQIDINEIPTKGQTPIDQIYIIRGEPDDPINAIAVFGFFNEVKSALETVSKDKTINRIGELLPD
jgi:hypothetical protein